MKTIKGLVVRTNGEVIEKEFPQGDLKSVQDEVGGWFECVSTEHALVYCNEEGNVLGLEPNLTASLFTGIDLVGTVVVFGLPNADGDDTSVPDIVRSSLLLL